MTENLYVLDGMALLYRAHFAFIRNPILTTKGVNTSALFGFTNTLVSILEKENPSHVAVAFDTPEPTARHKAYPEYKAQREEMPEDILVALPNVKRMVKAFGIPAIEMPGFEADDIVGTLARMAEEKGMTTYMVTPDKDFAQLVSDKTFIYKPAYQSNGFDIVGVADVLEKWGVERIEQVVDILGLWGDASDNIPGIPGIGEKTSKKLIAQFGSMEGLLENVETLKGKQKENVTKYGKQGLLSKYLATIIRDVPITVGITELVRGELEEPTLKEMFVEFEFNSIGKRIFGGEFKAGRGQGAQVDAHTDSGLEPAEQGLLFAGKLKTLADVHPRYRLAETEDDQRSLAADLACQKGVCFDTETTSLDPRTTDLVGISFSWKAGEAWFVPIPEDPEAKDRVLDIFRPFFANEAIGKTGHNLKFDLKVLKWQGVAVNGMFFDTMLAHAIIEPDQRHTMDFLAEAYLGYSPVSITRLIGEKKSEQVSMRDVPLAKLAEYAAEDADVTWQLRSVLEPKLESANRVGVFYPIESRLLPVLVEVEYAGIALDVDALSEISTQLGQAITDYQSRIFAMADTEFNLNSPKQLGEILFDKLHLVDKPKKTKTGQYKTDEQILTALAGQHEIARLILDYREASKLKSTYVDALPDAVLPSTGRIHTTFSQLAAATGRLASANPNLQNIPIRTAQGKEIRKAFIPRDHDHLLVSADYSQIELRIMAELSGDPGMREAFEQGLDVHATTAARVHGVPIPEVTDDMRRQAKMINYGLMYGMSTFGLSQRLGIPRKEAAEIVEHYFAEFPGIKKYIEDTIEFAREHGFVETISGRRRYLRDINSRNATTRNAVERNAVNSPIQGTGADMIKLAMIHIHQAFSEAGLRSLMVLQIHDELVFDVRRDEVDRVKTIVREGMVHALPMQVPIEVDIGVGANWLQAHG